MGGMFPLSCPNEFKINAPFGKEDNVISFGAACDRPNRSERF